MNMTKLVSSLALFAGCMLAKNADASPRWNYSGSYGMQFCQFIQPANIIGPVTVTNPRQISFKAKVGDQITVQMSCSRSEPVDKFGQLTAIGPEGTYSGPGGNVGSVIGEDFQGGRPKEFDFPKGRMWTFQVGNTTQTLNFAWKGQAMDGSEQSESIVVTVEPVVVAAPVTMPDVMTVVAPIGEKANTAYDLASNRDYKSRVASVTGNFSLSLNSISSDHSATMGWGIDVDAFFGPRGSFRGVAGVTGGMSFMQVPTEYAPGLPANGFNSYTNGKRLYLGPKVGGSYMPTDWFNFQFWGSVGVLANIWDTVPLSQLPNGALYTGESQTMAAFGYKVAVEANFIIADHFVIGPSLGLLGNFSQLPLARGPERVCSSTDGSCLVQRKGQFLDVPLFFRAGAVF